MATLNAKIPAGPLEQKWDNHRFDMKLVNPANNTRITTTDTPRNSPNKAPNKPSNQPIPTNLTNFDNNQATTPHTIRVTTNKHA